MDVLKAILPLVLTGSLAAVVLAVGLEATTDDVLYLVRHPNKLMRAILAISIVVPAVAVLLADLLPLRQAVRIGIILMAVSPLPPFVPGKVLALGCRKAYVVGLFAAFAVLTVLIVPATVALLDRLYGATVYIAPAAVARTILIGVLAPLAVGVAVRAAAPRFAERAAPWISKIGMLLLILALAPILAVTWRAILNAIGNGS